MAEKKPNLTENMPITHEPETGQFTPEPKKETKLKAKVAIAPNPPKVKAEKPSRDYDPETVKDMASYLGYSPKKHPQGATAYAKGHIRGKFTQDNFDEMYDLWDRDSAPMKSMKYNGNNQYVPWESEEEKRIRFPSLTKQDRIRKGELENLAKAEYLRNLDEDEPDTEESQRSRASDLFGEDLTQESISMPSYHNEHGHFVVDDAPLKGQTFDSESELKEEVRKTPISVETEPKQDILTDEERELLSEGINGNKDYVHTYTDEWWSNLSKEQRKNFRLIIEKARKRREEQAEEEKRIRELFGLD